MKHFVNFSGGAGSWYTARRVVVLAAPGDEIHLVFADTLTEDADLYRFLEDAIEDITRRGDDAGVTVIFTPLIEGRDVWEVFFAKRFIGNSRIDPCSKILKRDLIRKHIEEKFDVDDTVVYLGIDWSEEHRFTKAKPYWEPYAVKAPLCDPPYVDKAFVLQEMADAGIAPPRLYAMGFPHNNCGGFCVKSGMGAFKLLLEKLPDRYAYHEQKEREFRQMIGKNVSILRDRSGGTVTPLTLEAFRHRVQGGGEVDEFDLGGCACFTPDGDS